MTNEQPLELAWQIFSKMEDDERQLDPFSEISISEEKFHKALEVSGISKSHQHDVTMEIIRDMDLESVCIEDKGWCYRRRSRQ
jgi:hypothetical protein